MPPHTGAAFPFAWYLFFRRGDERGHGLHDVLNGVAGDELRTALGEGSYAGGAVVVVYGQRDLGEGPVLRWNTKLMASPSSVLTPSALPSDSSASSELSTSVKSTSSPFRV